MYAGDKIINAMGTVNDVLLDVFSPTGTRCFLLKRGEHTKAFVNVLELTSGFNVVFDENRSESGLLEYANSDVTIRDTWSQSTHIGYGVPDADDQIEVYAFVDGEKDAIDPNGFSPFWSGRVAKLANERYAV